MATKKMGSYENPNRIDYGWQSLLGELKAGQKQVSSFNENAQRNAYEKSSQNTFYDQFNNYKNQIENFDNAVTSLSKKTSGLQTFDDNVRNTFRGESDALWDAAKELDAGNITYEQYRKIEQDAFSRLNNFTTALPSLTVQAQEWQKAMEIEPGNYGAVSSTTPTEAEQVMFKWGNGGDVRLKFDGNNPMLYSPDESGNTNGQMLNLGGIHADYTRGKDFVNIIDNYSETLTGGFNNIFQPDNQASTFITRTTEPDPANPNQEIIYQTITDDQKEQGIQAMMDKGQFDGLLNNKRLMTMIWQDQMDDKITGDDSWGVTDPNKSPEENKAMLANQRDLANRFLAEKAFDENAKAYGIKKAVSIQNKPKPPSSNVGGTGGTSGGSSRKGTEEERKRAEREQYLKENFSLSKIDATLPKFKQAEADALRAQGNIAAAEAIEKDPGNYPGGAGGIDYNKGRKDFFNIMATYNPTIFKLGSQIDDKNLKPNVRYWLNDGEWTPFDKTITDNMLTNDKALVAMMMTKFN